MPRFKFKRQAKFPCPSIFSIPLFILFIVLVFVLGFPISVFSTSLNPVSLYKCSENLPQEFFEIPQMLQIQYPEEKLNYSRVKFGEENFFNFSLTNDKNEKSCFNSKLNSNSSANSTFEFETFIFEIPAILDAEFESNFEFTPDGFLIHYNEDGTSEIYYHRENYCVQEISKEKIFVKVCKSECHFSSEEKGEQPCLLKCCPIGQVMTFNSNITEAGKVKLSCEDALEEDWTPLPESETETQSKNSEKTLHPNLFYNRKKFKCDETLNETFSQGKACFLPAVSKWRGNIEKFCADGFWDSNKFSVYPAEKSLQFMKQCFSKSKSTNSSSSEMLTTGTGSGKKMLTDPDKILFHANVLFSVALVASVIYLFTILVYLSLGTSQKAHGLLVLTVSTFQCLLHVTLCAAAGIHVFAGPRAWFHHDIKPCARVLKPNLTCLSMGILHQFLLISSFSWTTTLTFDAWTKITSLKPTSSVSVKKGRKHFLKYCLFGFGFPLSFVSLSILMEFGISSDSGLIRPGFTRTCVILEGWNYFIYITIPLVILFILNMTMAILTLEAVLDAKKDIKSFKDSHTNSSFQNKTSLILKLFVLMGVFLCFEIMLAFWSPIKVSRYFAIFDFYRIGNALGLFWIFVMNKKVHSQLSDRYPVFKKYMTMSRNTTVTNLSKEFSSNSNSKST